MKKRNLIVALTLLPVQLAIANCDLTRFRWDCDLPMQSKPSRVAQSVVYCHNIRGYLTPAEYANLKHFHHHNINMVLKVNGEYIESPCVPNRQFDYVE